MRNVRVSSISLPGTGPREDRLQAVLQEASRYIDLAARDEPDLLVLPETINGLGLSGEKWTLCAEDVPGPTTDFASAKAVEHGLYLLCPMVRKDSLGAHNSALLLDPSGRVVSKYDKVYPTVGEIENGVVPGEKGVTYDAPFGRLGFAICFDLNFRDPRDFYREKGIDILLFPSMFRGGTLLRIWAYEMGCYLVSATPGEQSAIVSPLGRILDESYNYNRIITRRLNLDFQILHLDYNFEKLEEVKKAYGPRVRFEVASPEGIFLLFSHDPGRTSDQIVDEFGLETREEYLSRSRIARGHASAK